MGGRVGSKVSRFCRFSGGGGSGMRVGTIPSNDISLLFKVKRRSIGACVNKAILTTGN